MLAFPFSARLIVALWALLCLSGAVSAEEVSEPGVSVEGLLVCKSGRYAIVRVTGGEAYLVRPGQSLGSYVVHAVDPHQIVLGYGSARFPIAMAGDANAALSQGPSLRLQGASLPHAVKLVCLVDRKEVQIAPDVSGKVTLHSVFVASQAMDQVLQNTSFGWTKHRGVTIVARQTSLKAVVARFEQNLSSLSQAPVKKVSMDFMMADLAFVCQISAKEMKLSIEGQPPSGNVTCWVSARPVAQTLALACALQPNPVAVSLKGTSLVFQAKP
ncbi:MAG: hypothetical protein AMXMBFR33_25540 [Candidatus Xenobia bacterium]|jgi:hypothetical protein